MRLDKWLWAARFFKTRSLAQVAIEGGKVKWNGQTVKAAREVKPGDHVQIRISEHDQEVIVQALNEYRRPAPEARLLYAETETSALARSRAAELKALSPTPGQDMKGRPTKRDRRHLAKFRGEI